MQEPKHIAAGGSRSGIHLSGATALALDELIAKSGSESSRAIGAPAIHDNDFSSGVLGRADAEEMAVSTALR